MSLTKWSGKAAGGLDVETSEQILTYFDLMSGLTFSNELISRDESLHAEFAP